MKVAYSLPRDAAFASVPEKRLARLPAHLLYSHPAETAGLRQNAAVCSLGRANVMVFPRAWPHMRAAGAALRRMR
jgi:hypothetical protein